MITDTTPQSDLIRNLVTERVVPADAAARLLGRLAANEVSVTDAKAAISWLFRQPKVAGTAPAPSGIPTAEVVPAGRYAVATEDGATNALAFYKVDRPTEGRWAGRVFVKLIVSDDEQRLSFAASKAVLAKIAAVGAEAASAAYGHEIGACGVCSRTLTNDESRERGIGPICAEKMGW